MIAALMAATTLADAKVQQPPAYTGPPILSHEERKTRALESIAETLLKLANQLAKVESDPHSWYRVTSDSTIRYAPWRAASATGQ